MKGSKAMVMIGVSFAAAAGAVVLASQWMNEQAGINSRKVMVASTDINLGTRLSGDVVRMVDWPADSVPAGAFSDGKQIDSRVTRVAVQRGEPILESKLASPGATGGLSAVVAEGKRAMTVRVNDVIGVAGFALPGNYVDILVSTQGERRPSDTSDQNISKLVLERILVLAVAQEASQNDTRPKVVNAVTLEVTPEQAEKLDLARSVGQLSLVLRNQIDHQPAETTGATKATLLSQAKPEPVKTKDKDKAEQKAAEAARPARKPAGTAKSQPAAAEQCQSVLTGSGHITQCR
ncbi:Flp pilus assembly protein CpaB [Noviherbaspirillum sp. CPCC 100848]|uniref:Flp pilus assembly protein CpaB n=1 Tax=Noviherbaspirillum album TaxID=3080276 RepID=A0ABU6J2C2_9BURK|nr:Flp pilus assembly protein CpaB [Noviherbaspirillum sp. CPCC 100848]MEC4717770.1 Flp pilus assembly protein CpaB [Noviherbaspirillum sp. CPCC 100848]